MGMSMSIQGFRPPDQKWKDMKEVYDACVKAKIVIPDSVMEFFNWDDPDDAGVEVALDLHPAVSGFNADASEGFEVDLKQLPEDLTHIRFTLRY